MAPSSGIKRRGPSANKLGCLVRHLAYDKDRHCRLERADACQCLAEAGALDVLHREVRITLADGEIVDRDDISVGAATGGLCLAPEADEVVGAIRADRQIGAEPA
jgi:hypothetical protein